MNKKLLFFLFSFSTMFAQHPPIHPIQEQVPQLPHQTIVNVNIPNNVSAQSSNTNASSSTSHNQNQLQSQMTQQAIIDIKNELVSWVKQTSTMVNDMKNKMINFMKQKVENTKDRATGLFNGTKELISRHRFKLIAATIAFVYGRFFFKAWNAKLYVTKDDTWFSWKKNLPMETLLAVPQKKLSEELMTEIQKHYVNAKDPANFLEPLAQFMNDSDKELKQLKSYLNLHEWIANLYLKKIFPFRAEITILREKIQRLIYFKNLFSSWVATYKLAKNKPGIEAG